MNNNMKKKNSVLFSYMDNPNLFIKGAYKIICIYLYIYIYNTKKNVKDLEYEYKEKQILKKYCKQQ